MSTERMSLEELRARLRNLQDKLPRTGQVAVDSALMAMDADVVRNRLSGQYLGVVTGRGRRSIQHRSEIRGNRVVGRIGTRVRYMIAHERGFDGDVSVPAHSRRMRSKTVQVRAHQRRLRLRARHYLRDTLRTEKPKFSRRVRRAVLLLAQTGRVPVVGDVI